MQISTFPNAPPETHQEFYFLYKSQFEAGKQSCTVAYLGGTVQDEVKADKTIHNSSKTEES